MLPGGKFQGGEPPDHCSLASFNLIQPPPGHLGGSISCSSSLRCPQEQEKQKKTETITETRVALTETTRASSLFLFSSSPRFFLFFSLFFSFFLFFFFFFSLFFSLFFFFLFFLEASLRKNEKTYELSFNLNCTERIQNGRFLRPRQTKV